MKSSANIGEICRSILRQRCEEKTILTNPICSPYSVNHLCLPIQCRQKPSCSTNLFGLNDELAPMKFIVNGKCQSIASDQCVQMICQTILDRIHCQIPEEDFALLCYSLPSWIREIMCKSPWLTPTDLIQWMSNDIINEAKKCFPTNDPQRSTSRTNVNETDRENRSNVPSRDRSNSPSKIRSNAPSKVQSNSPSKVRTNPSSKVRTDAPNGSPTFDDDEPMDNAEEKSSGISTNSDENDRRSIDSESNSNVSENDPRISGKNRNEMKIDEKSRKGSKINSTRSPSTNERRIEFPGEIDRQAGEQLKKCWNFYQQMREHFDEDIAAMLFKCCLCYGNCSTKN